jgi:hypothetical protein
LTAQVMRHESVYTAERYYLHQTRLDHSKKVREGSVGPLSRDEVASD